VFLTRIDDVDGDDYRAHQHVMALFEKQRVLFQRKGHEILVLSKKPRPDSEDVSGITDSATEGQRFLFRLRVNPAVTRFLDGKNRRVGMPAEKIEPWLDALFAKHGFAADYVTRREGLRLSRKGENSISLLSVLAIGVLTVKDTGKFRAAVSNGIGHGKGLGFGLLNIFDVM